MKGIAQIQSGSLFGTAFLVSPTKVITAAHCIDGAVGTIVDISFRNRPRGSFPPTSARVLAKNDEFDVAILELQGPLPVGLEPYELCGCGNLDGQSWSGFGFPASQAGLTNGMKLTGQLIDSEAQLAFDNNVPAIQASCTEAAGWTRLRLNGRAITVDLNEPHILGGVSGGPVCANGQTGRVVGIIRWAGTPNNQIVFATRIEDVYRIFQQFLSEVILHPWRSDSEFFIQTQTATPNLVFSNLDEQSIAALWDGHGAKTLDCDLTVREAGSLAPVILRLFAHAPTGLVLRSSNNASWRTKVQALGEDWFPHGDFDAAEVASRCHHQIAGPMRSVGTRTEDDFCRLMQRECDLWVLRRLDEKWQQLLVNPASQTIGYQPSPDNLDEMSQTWEVWYPLLERDPNLCHHFLTLMLKADGTHNCQEYSGIGLGPKTFSQCLWPSLVFSLLLSPHFPHAFRPTQPLPGNLGATPPGGPRRSGHICGIRRHNNKLLSLGLQGHRWASKVVMLPGTEMPASAMDSSFARFDQEIGAVPTGLNKRPPDVFIYPAEATLLQAAATSLEAVRNYIEQRENEQVEKQKKYASQSGAR